MVDARRMDEMWRKRGLEIEDEVIMGAGDASGGGGCGAGAFIERS